MSLSHGLIKTAFFGFGKKKPEPKITDEHVKKILPAFKKAEEARKKSLAGQITQAEYGDLAEPFINSVAEVEHTSGIHNEKLYAHMYEHHAYDRKKK